MPADAPGSHGGNIDIKHLVVGSSLYLPVQVGGAQFYEGDPHYAQGNGEVALTALETSLRATDEDLDEAMRKAVRNAITFVNTTFDVP